MGPRQLPPHRRGRLPRLRRQPQLRLVRHVPASPSEAAALANGTGIDMAALQNDWNQIVDAALQEATLQRPAAGGFVPTGKQGMHSEHLGFVLAEMQSLARAHPQATW